MTDKQNQGEGNRDAARAYNEAQQKFVKDGKVDKKAEEARRAVEGDQAEELKKAEREGKARAREKDPEVRRDYSKPS